MPVSRKHRSMKKSSRSSKRSKNVRTSKKTRKHMKKMRGGGGLNPGFNQAVDFIIYSGDKVLVSKNNVVTGIENKTNNNTGKWTLIGTFASSSQLNRGIVGNKVNHSEKGEVERRIKSAKETIERSPTLLESFKKKELSLDKVTLHSLKSETALSLLKKDLAEKKINLSSLSNILDLNNIIKVDNDKFHYVEKDKRLNDCENNEMPCVVVTQLFKVKVDESQMMLFPSPKFEWKKYDSEEIFSGHRKLLIENKNLFTSSTFMNKGDEFGFPSN